jgi:hypothetical protein
LKLLLKQRRRLASAIVVAAVLVVGFELWNSHPRETEIRVALGAGHRNVVGLGLRFVQEGEEMHGLRLAFTGGAPRVVPCMVRLGPGRYRVRGELRLGDGRRIEFERALNAPADGPVRIEVEPSAAPGKTPGPEEQH